MLLAAVERGVDDKPTDDAVFPLDKLEGHPARTVFPVRLVRDKIIRWNYMNGAHAGCLSTGRVRCGERRF
jgi:hypothetical protein